MAEKNLRICSVLFLVLLSTGIYWNTLPNDFVAGDRQFILRNQNLGDYNTVLQSFTSDYWEILGGESFVYFRPITIISHFIDYKLYGLHPAGHHFSNMVLHTIVTLMVYQLFLCFFSFNLRVPLIGAGLFALHPIHTHSVSYVMGRTDILAALFYLGALILLIRTNQRTNNHYKWLNIIAACFCYLLALLSKEIAVTLPAVFLLYWLCWPAENHSRKSAGFWVSFLSLCIILSVYLLIRFMSVGLSIQEDSILSWYSLWQRIATIFITYGFYLWKLFFPLRLCYYSNIVIPASWDEIVTSPLFWAGISLTLSFFMSIKWIPKLSFMLGWVILSLIPVLNIIPIPHLAKENFLYIPSIGFCLLPSLFFKNGNLKTEHSCLKYHTSFLLLFIVIGIFYMGATVKRNNDYRDPLIFLESTLRGMTPIPPQAREDIRFHEGVKNFFVSHRNLGILYQERRQWKKSSRAFENALTFTPDYFSPEYGATVKVLLGQVYEKMGMLEKASQLLLEARSASSKTSKIDNLLGVISIKSGENKQAEVFFKRAIQKDGTYAPAHYNLGILYMETDSPQKGREELLKAIQLNPNYQKALPEFNNRPAGKK